MKKNIINLLFVSSFLFTGCSETKKEDNLNKASQSNISEKTTDSKTISDVPKEDYAVISTSFGDMTVQFFEGAAPKHVESFKTHANNGFYNGTIFHRVIPGFMIQGGDPNTKGENKASYGTGGHSAKYYGIGIEDDSKTWNLPAEFNNIKHTRGILSMARSNDPNSGGSQFFICAANVPHLNSKYTVFGQVVEGDEIIDQIINLPRDARDNPNRRVEMSVRIEQREK
ncbi:peptidylprolyl isomerase [Candidatus Marinimicrobia bacterium]|nr:peptidylprolyl isomerase [Candidatus Neomarinimicrobiota bacterium]